MVAISLYRGNLHRVPDVPRRWLMPNPKITLRDFRVLLRKREKALNLLHRTAVIKPEEGVGDNGCSKPQNDAEKNQGNSLEEKSLQKTGVEELKEGAKADLSEAKVNDASASAADCGNDREEGGGAQSNSLQVQVENDDEAKNVRTNNLDIANEREKEKRDLEKKLQVLNERKHQLVQMLKQILNAEEEMKKRNNMQVSGIRPAGHLQVEGTTDITGSFTRHAMPRLSSDMNFSGDPEGGESEDVSNHQTHARQLYHMQSTSPSAASPLRRPAFSSIQHNAAPLTSRTSLGGAGYGQTTSSMVTGVTASPSRFAPSGHQGQSTNLPSVSVSGIPFVVSSPSPAASGGTSVFRDSRLTSPSWN